MHIMKFIRKQGKTKESSPKIFEESIECEVDTNDPVTPIIPLSSIRSELIKCGFKAEEPDKFMVIDNGKVKKVSIDCFDTVSIALPGGAYELKAVNYTNKDDIHIDKDKDLIEYHPIEVADLAIDGDHVDTVFTIFFGDFLKMVMFDQYFYLKVIKSFYDRLGDIPVFVSSADNEVYERIEEIDLVRNYVEVTTEKGETYIINLLL